MFVVGGTDCEGLALINQDKRLSKGLGWEQLAQQGWLEVVAVTTFSYYYSVYLGKVYFGYTVGFVGSVLPSCSVSSRGVVGLPL